MPIKKPGSLIYQVAHVAIHPENGSVRVAVALLLDGVEPRQVDSIVHDFSPEECAPIWQGQPAAGKTRWADLRDQLYGLLQAKGVIPA